MQPSPAPTTAELERARQWASQAFAADPAFRFTLADDDSAQLLAAWHRYEQALPLDEPQTGSRIEWRSPAGIVVSCEVVEYRDYPVVDWTVFIRNEGDSDTEIVSDLRALDAEFALDDGETVLHHHTGSPCRADDYRPHTTPLAPNEPLRISTSGGRSSNSDLPYFALDTGGSFVLMAVGWPGQWEASFERAETGVRMWAKQQDTHFRLRPGESVRLPRIALLFSDGDRVRAQNTWRRWMLAHIVPRPNGQVPEPQLTPCSSKQFDEMIHADEASQKLFIDRYVEKGLKPDYWWMDAGWYPNEWGWPNTGTWEVDTSRFPNGLRAITDHAHEQGIRTIVWFEPERVTKGTWLYDEHPEWLLTNPADPGGNKLLNLGNPAAREWLTDHVDAMIAEQGIDLYRQDFNMDPLDYWRAVDEPDRQGISENRHVSGLLAYWDELLRRHPGMLIDECASGGRRNDLEMMSRSVPLLRSDFIFDDTAQQCHTYGMASWIPWFGTGAESSDVYALRSMYALNVIACWDVRRDNLDYDTLRRTIEQWRGYAPLMLGDFAPLTDYHLETDVWMAWQFDRPDLGRGMVQAFRRADSPYDSALFVLRGLDPATQYRVRDIDDDDTTEVSGETLIGDGLQVRIGERRAARIVLYERV